MADLSAQSSLESALIPSSPYHSILLRVAPSVTNINTNVVRIVQEIFIDNWCRNVDFSCSNIWLLYFHRMYDFLESITSFKHLRLAILRFAMVQNNQKSRHKYRTTRLIAHAAHSLYCSALLARSVARMFAAQCACRPSFKWVFLHAHPRQA